MKKNIQEFTCFLFNKKHAEMGVATEDMPVSVSIDMGNVSYVRERIEDGESDDVCLISCIVGLKSGEDFVIGSGYNEVMKLWRNG